MSKKPVRVLHVFGRMERGGAEMRTLDIMRQIDRTSYRLDFCALSGQTGSLDETIRALGGQVHHLKLGNNFPAQFIRLLKKNKYDVVHSHVHHSSGFILMLAAIARVPNRIAHFRSSGDGRIPNLRRKLQSSVMKFCIDRCATRILAVSQEAMNAAWDRGWHKDERCQVIYNGVHHEDFLMSFERDTILQSLGLPKERNIFIHIGRYDPAKNHEKLIGVFAQVLRWDESAVLLLVGGGPKERERKLREQIEKLGIMDSVRLLGQRTDIPQMLTAADVMIFPSSREGLPGAVLEASAAGVPVLASNLPVIEEISSQLPLLRFLSLTTHDGEWANQALSLLAEGRAEGMKKQAIETFAQSSFTVGKSAEAHMRVWDNCNGPC